MEWGREKVCFNSSSDKSNSHFNFCPLHGESAFILIRRAKYSLDFFFVVSKTPFTVLKDKFKCTLFKVQLSFPCIFNLDGIERRSTCPFKKICISKLLAINS